MPTSPLYQVVAERLKRRLKDGTYKSGERLPGERELAEEFAVSRVTVREAQIALQALGLIEVKAGSGAYVSHNPISNEDFPLSISALELTEARLLFESEAAALAARDISAEALEHMAGLVDIVSKSHPRNSDAALKADQAFHLAIARASNNAAVEHTITSLWRMRTRLPHIRDAHDSVCSDDAADERGNEHQEILNALTRRDPDAARQAMRAHFKRLLKSLIDASEALAVEEQRVKAAKNRTRFLDLHTPGVEA